MIDKELLEAEFLFVGSVCYLVLGEVIIVFLNRRQADGLWRIPQPPE